jgi:hypothetical protein
MVSTKRRRGKPPNEATDPPPTAGETSATNGREATTAEGNDPAAEPRKPVHVVSYLVARDTFIQASIWTRQVTLGDGTEFAAHDVSLRKRCKDANGEWQSFYSFRGSELYAVAHAVNQANAWILETRAVNDCPF